MFGFGKKNLRPDVPQNWEVYLREEEGAPASIAVNLALIGQSALAGQLPCLLSVQVGILHPTENGLCTSDERPALNAIEDAMDAAVGAELGAVFIGHRIGWGALEMLFYSRSEAGLERTVNKVATQFPTYRFAVRHQDDREWCFYRAQMYPDSASRHQIRNRQVIQVLQEHGDELTAAREVQHWAYFPDPSARSRFADQVRQTGFAVTEIEPDPRADASRRYGVLISRNDHVDHRSIDALVMQLVQSAEACGGEYDGWETQVIPPGSGAPA